MIKNQLSKEAKKLLDEKIKFDSQVEEFENAQFEIGESDFANEEALEQAELEREYQDLLCEQQDEELDEVEK